MRVSYKSQADKKPQELKLNHLYGNTYELYATANIEEVDVENLNTEAEEGAPAKRTEYMYDEYFAKQDISGYEEAVAALIGLKYSFADEIALSRKGNAKSEDAEYTAYLKYVEDCKAYARAYFGITAEETDGENHD